MTTQDTDGDRGRVGRDGSHDEFHATCMTSLDGDRSSKAAVDKNEHENLDEEFEIEKERPVILASTASCLRKDDKLLDAARVLREIDPASLTCEERELISKAESIDLLVTSLRQSIPRNASTGIQNENDSDGWVSVGESDQNDRNTSIHYKFDLKVQNPRLDVCVHTTIDKSLLVPLISVLNESELYTTWIPSWSMPRFGIRRVKKLRQMGRCSQILLVTIDAPWPFAPREVVLRALAVDDIDSSGDIVIQLTSLETGDEGGLVPEVDEQRIRRLEFHGGFLIQKYNCSYELSSGDGNEKEQTSEKRIKSSDGGGSDMLLVSFNMSLGDKVPAPQWLRSFLIRTVIAMCWNMLLDVAEGVRDGKRLRHAQAIREKRERLYDWVDERVAVMLSEL